MKKESQMLRQKKEQVEKRRKEVEKACVECLDEGIKISYKEISLRTNIPHKTLERNPYKDDIRYYKKVNNKDKIKDAEINMYRDKIKYLYQVIKQLNKENHELKTKLYYEGKI